MKGMFASVGLYNQYYEIWDDVQSMNLDTQDILFCGTSTPLAYLDAEVEFGTMGTPFFKLNYKRYEDYLLLHPEKHPTIVYFYEIADDDRNNLFFSRLIELNDIEYRGKRLIIRMRRDRSISLHSNMSIMK